MKLLLLPACLLFAFAGGYAAQSIALSQIQSQPYPGVMVNIVGRGWVQAQIDSSLQIVTTTNPPTLKALGGSAGVPGPPGPMGPQGNPGVQGPMGPQGIAGASAPSLPITVAADGKTLQMFGIQTTGPGPSIVTLTKSDGTPCMLTVTLVAGAIACN